MVRKFAALFALILTFGLAAAPVAGQDLDLDDFESLGVNGANIRMYLSDDAMTDPDAELLGVMIVGIEFDSSETLDQHFEEFTCGFASGFLDVAAVENCEDLVDAGFAVSDVDGIGDQAIEVIGMGEGVDAMPTTMLALQADNYLFVVLHLGVEEPSAGDDIGTFLANAEQSDAEVVFSDDGTSTGGFYDMLPQAGDAEIEGLTPMMDQDMFGTPVGTPAN